MFGYLKGKIDLQLEKANLAEGETARGTVRLKLKKPLQARGVYVELLRVRRKNKGTDYFVVNKKEIAKAGTYSGETFSFDFKIPSNLIAKLPEGTLGTIIKSAAVLLRTSISNSKWYIVARLDMKGFDVKKKVRIYLS